jgi:hypothetical protein
MKRREDPQSQERHSQDDEKHHPCSDLEPMMSDVVPERCSYLLFRVRIQVTEFHLKLIQVFICVLLMHAAPLRAKNPLGLESLPSAFTTQYTLWRAPLQGGGISQNP